VDGWPSRRIASMQITAAASNAQKSSRSPGRGRVAASSQPIRAMSQASTIMSQDDAAEGRSSR
jgi:hypothetical protein